MKLLRRHSDEPERPRGVRLVLPTGDELDVAVEYDGEDVNGVHQWVGIAPVELHGGVSLRVDVLPARTSVVLRPMIERDDAARDR